VASATHPTPIAPKIIWAPRFDMPRRAFQIEILRKEHEEEIRIGRGIESRKGNRTGGRWIPFCPVCHIAIPGEGSPQGGVYCNAQKMLWDSNLTWFAVPEIVASFG
jgi:hypothetical protein